MLFPGAGQAQGQFFGNEQQPPAAPPQFGGQPVQQPAATYAPMQPPAGAETWQPAPVGQTPQPPSGLGQPVAAHTGTVPQGFGQTAQQAAPGGFGAPPMRQEAPPDNPWGQVPPVQNPYAG